MKKFFICILVLSVSFFLNAQLPQLSLVQLATGYTKPLDIKNCGDQRLFVVEQTGYIRILYKDGTKQTTPFLDIDARVNSSGDEQGLLGLAFSPNYKQDGFFYVNYTDTGTIFSPSNSTVYTRISRFSVFPNDSTRADPNSEVILLQFPQPYSNHNGGNMMFGPDGYLYISQGDGGSGNDPLGSGQNKNTFHGKMLRIDVTGQATYVVPPSNPFVGVANTKPEIWAYGLRNPWRCSFDKLTGDLWIGDVGQGDWEEIDFQDALSVGGENYGWRCREGLHQCAGCNQSGCTGTGYTDPVFEVASTTSCSVTGGYVYRGTQYGKLFSSYIFTDYCSGKFWSINRTGINTFVPNQLTVNSTFTFQLTSLGQDNLGELYVAYRGTGTGGRIYRIVETTDCKPVAFISLSDSVEGCSPVTLIALRGDTLSYQWYNSNGVIGGATSFQYATQQSGWYKVMVSKPQVGCEAMSDSVYVNVLDTTAVDVTTTTLPTCINSSNLNLVSNVIPSGGIFSGSGVSGNVFVSASGNVGNNSVNYSYTNLSGCSSIASFVVVLSDTSIITRNSTDTLVCIAEPSFIMNNYTSPVGGDFTGNGVVSNSFDAATAGAGTSAVTYTFTNIAGCESRYVFNLEVGNETALTKNITTTIFCSTSTPVSLASYISPSGGIFSGNGISNDNFDPAAAPIGVSTIVYQYTNSFGCISVDSFQLQVSICTNIKAAETDFSFSIFPNPGKSNFNLKVSVNSSQQTELTIIDVTGKICFRKDQLLESGKTVIPLQLPQLSAGVYSVQLKGDKGKAVKTLVIE
ncbi:MAG: PQQ-dependent sugar dehydrogenase [Bacteroidota bacterium]